MAVFQLGLLALSGTLALCGTLALSLYLIARHPAIDCRWLPLLARHPAAGHLQHDASRQLAAPLHAHHRRVAAHARVGFYACSPLPALSWADHAAAAATRESEGRGNYP